MIDFLATFIVFFAVIDPIGTLPVYLAVTQKFEAKARRRIAYVAVTAAAGILLFFVIAGELILNAMRIPLASFQIAGGVILFVFAMTMIFGSSKPEAELKMTEEGHETAIFPLAMPSIASPGAILAAVLLTENARVSILDQVFVAATMLGVLVVQFLLLMAADPIQRRIGAAGASIISRVMGMLLAAVATTHAITGLRASFGI